MEQKDIGKTFYFLEPIMIEKNSLSIIYKGVLSAIIPKYNFLDKYNAKYARDTNYIFKVVNYDGTVANKTTTCEEHIYPDIDSAMQLTQNDTLFHYSVIKGNLEQT